MKIYICTDIEGVSGVVHWDDCTPEGRYYTRSKYLLTEEVNAAVTGALEGGATEVVVWDGHGCGGVDIDKLHPEAKLLMGRPIPKTIGLDGSYDGVFFVGQHAMNRTPCANLCHSYSSVSISNMFLNGMAVGEFGLRTAVAGAMGLPVLLLTGDDAACREAMSMVPGIETAQVKVSVSREAALCLSPAKARETIRRAAREAMGKIGEVKPFKMEGPFELVTEYYSRDAQTKENRGFDRPLGEKTVVRSANLLDLSL